MSGIVGLYYLDSRPVDPVDLGKMTDILAHRGPDDADIWYDGSVGLGHRMLWTTPESLHEKLPATNQSSDLVITADARIDNRDDLIPLLGLNDRPAGDVTDSQLILAAYKKWGEQCPEKLIGAFAFAIWDKQRQELFCARDYIGFKPFYYHHRPGHIFAFGSEIKALFCLPDVPRTVNELMIGYYLARFFDDVEMTFYNDILRLLPAHTLTVTTSGIRMQRYWKLDPNYRVELDSDEEYVEAFKDVFNKVVSSQLRSAYPVGLMLSGGLDSSAIAVEMRELLTRSGKLPLKTFSILFGGDSEADERPYIDALVAQGGLEPHFIHGNQLAPLDALEDMLWFLDQPLHNANMFVVWELYRVAAQQGVRVLFDGGGGDKTMGDTTAQVAELIRSGRWYLAFREAQGLAEKFDCTPWDVLRDDGLKPLTPSPVLQTYRTIRYRRTNHSTPSVGPTINPDFARRINLVANIAELTEAEPEFHTSARDEHYSLLTLKYDSTELEWFNIVSAPFRINSRAPFLDRRLVESLYAFPWQQKTQKGQMRLLARRAFANQWPAAVTRRTTKADMGLNFRKNLWVYNRKQIAEIIFDDTGELEAYVNLSRLKQIHDDPDLHHIREAGLITYEAVTLGTWLKNLTQFPNSQRGGGDIAQKNVQITVV